MNHSVTDQATEQKSILDPQEKEVLRRIITKFREWYASLTVQELSRNRNLIKEISALENTFRAALV